MHRARAIVASSTGLAVELHCRHGTIWITGICPRLSLRRGDQQDTYYVRYVRGYQIHIRDAELVRILSSFVKVTKQKRCCKYQYITQSRGVMIIILSFVL
jgi:hypothetical protein